MAKVRSAYCVPGNVVHNGILHIPELIELVLQHRRLTTDNLSRQHPAVYIKVETAVGEREGLVSPCLVRSIESSELDWSIYSGCGLKYGLENRECPVKLIPFTLSSLKILSFWKMSASVFTTYK